MKKLKYALIQPLTGGVVFAAENAFGHPAEYILSYPGLDSPTYKKDGSIKSVGNEYHFLEYLKKKDRLPLYLQFEHGMFDKPEKVTLKTSEAYKKEWNGELPEVDLIAAVPVCSGLSAANTVDHGKKDSAKNDNLKFITEYVLNELKPKVYIFENAPKLYNPPGSFVRDYLNEVAENAGYSVTYVRTDTCLHHNIQNRRRTFVIFWKWLDGQKMPPPEIFGENVQEKTLVDYLNKIPKWASQNKDENKEKVKNNLEYQFIKSLYGKKWREVIDKHVRFKSFILQNNLLDDFLVFCENHKNNSGYTSTKRAYEHASYKLSLGKGFMDRTLFYLSNDKPPTVYHGVTDSSMHPTEDRLLTMREYMHLMGMPHDFEYLHDWKSFSSVIGQNVPVKTFEHWLSECKRVLEDWPTLRKKFPSKDQNLLKKNNDTFYFFDNLDPKRSHYG